VSMTGTYKWDEEEGRLVKVSDRIPSLGYLAEASIPRHGIAYGYVDEHIRPDGKPVLISSRKQKHEMMRAFGVHQRTKGEVIKNPERSERVVRARNEKFVRESVEKYEAQTGRRLPT